jgi:hypothetical protein
MWELYGNILTGECLSQKWFIFEILNGHDLWVIEI